MPRDTELAESKTFVKRGVVVISFEEKGHFVLAVSYQGKPPSDLQMNNVRRDFGMIKAVEGPTSKATRCLILEKP